MQAEQSWSVLCRGYANLEVLTERKKKFSLFCSNATAAKQPLLPSCCLEGSDECPLLMDISILKELDAPEREPPQRSTAHIPFVEHLIHRRPDELAKHMSAI